MSRPFANWTGADPLYSVKPAPTLPGGLATAVVAENDPHRYTGRRLGKDETISSLTDTAGAGDRFLGARVLAHPDPTRVGDFAPLFDSLAVEATAAMEISRTSPSFRASDGATTGPLESRRITRTPLRMVCTGAGLRLLRSEKAAVEINGVPLAADRNVTEAELETGIVVLLGKDLALWVGWMESPDSTRKVAGLVGESAAMLKVREQIQRVADLDVPVLLRGATGVGKELVAAAIHRRSRRASGAYVAVNVAGFPPTMAASELFGHTRGAFTGAFEAREGYFAQASGGTLFLDEIGDVSFDVQALLLRAVQEGVIQPLGGKTRHVDVRLIAATDSDLESAVARREFREPLLRRFSYEIRIPPLRERRDDVGLLFYHLLGERLKMTGELERLTPSPDGDPFVPAAYVASMALYDWPGNVRELANVALRFAIENRGRPRTRVGDELWAAIRPRAAGERYSGLGASPVAAMAPQGASLAGSIKAAPSDEDILEALRAEGFRRERAARRLGVSKSFLYRRLIGSPGAPKADGISTEEIKAALSASDGDLVSAAERLRISVPALRLQLRRLEQPSPDDKPVSYGRPRRSR